MDSPARYEGRFGGDAAPRPADGAPRQPEHVAARRSADEALAEAVRSVRDRVDAQPTFALILGSGLGDLADAAEGATAIATSDIPHYPRSTVAGHSGRLVFGTLEGREVVFIQGRAHLYEGHPLQAVAFPVRLVHALGAQRMLVTNAAGGIHPRLRPGTLMFITDHLNMVSGSAMRASVHETAPPRPPRTANPYDLTWLDQAEQIALDLHVRTQRGVYLWTRGPSYETRAEIAAYRRIGADAVGMSTVPEVLEAASRGMKVLGISSITNPAAGLSKEPLSHDEVLQVGQQVRGELERLVRGILKAPE